MSTTSPKEPLGGRADEPFDYELAEGLRTARHEQRLWREWVMVAIGLAAVLAVLARQLDPGRSQVVSAQLTAGRYELVCLMPGHYTAGQHWAFRVSG